MKIIMKKKAQESRMRERESKANGSVAVVMFMHAIGIIYMGILLF